MRYLPSSGGSWRGKAVGVLLLIAFLPLLLTVALQAVNELARAILDVLGPYIPYAVALLVLAGVYRLVLWRGRR